MSELFNFKKLKGLVENKHLSTIIIVDTNIFIENPEYRNWQTSCCRSSVLTL